MKNRSSIFQEQTGLRRKRRKLVDKWVRRIIATGGFAVIACILAILLFITMEVWPLFRPASVSLVGSFPLYSLLPDGVSAHPVAVGLEENREVGYVVTEDGNFRFFSLSDGKPRESVRLESIQGRRVTSVWQSIDGSRLALGTESGRVVIATVTFNPRFFEGRRSYRPLVSEDLALDLSEKNDSITEIAFAGDLDGRACITGITGSGAVLLYIRNVEEGLFDEGEISTSRFELERRWSGKPVSLALDGSIRNLYLGTDDGRIHHWNIHPDGDPEFITSMQATRGEGTGITVLDFLIGDRTLLVGDEKGGVSAYSLLRDSTAVQGWRLTKIHQMGSHSSAVVFIAPSARGKGFISADDQGDLLLQYTTSERTLAEFTDLGGSRGLSLIAFAPKADGALTIDTLGTLNEWEIDNPHPEAGLKAFFGKVWYEGYEKPEYVWQSSAATDDFEPKLSIVPLLFGSLKGTFYALILAVPLAIFSALYTSQFMHPLLRSYIKPAVEIMAALPSVVLGFLAGLWLAPVIEKVVPGVLLLIIVLPLLFIIFSVAWRFLPVMYRGRFRPGIEVIVLLPVAILGIWFCLEFNQTLERLLFEGNFTQWLYDTARFRYDQRNALIVGFVMGFAVIPIIYTISEDALSNVPRHLMSGSLALGATRWQTAVHVVLPAAHAGILSAVMIGFGRAVGETMIVLMATGNTPIMDWNIFNGFRTLSANIAVEIPEAPQGGTLYRVLFLTALILFLITFLVNTTADVVRQRLRKKYKEL